MLASVEAHKRPSLAATIPCRLLAPFVSARGLAESLKVLKRWSRTARRLFYAMQCNAKKKKEQEIVRFSAQVSKQAKLAIACLHNTLSVLWENMVSD
jgi:hypothetical protein